MLLIMCVLFLMFDIRYLCKGRLFHETMKDIAISLLDMQLAKMEGRREKEGDILYLGGKVILLLLFAIIMLILNLVTYSYLWDIDPYKWPTLLLMVLLIWSLFRASLKSRGNYSTKEEIIVAKAKIKSEKRYSAYRIFDAILSCFYYGYIILTISGIIHL